MNLTGATVNFVMRAITAASPAVNKAATIVNPTAPAKVSYTPVAADVQYAGQYMASWLVTFANGSVQTFPTVGYLEVTIEEDLVTPGGSRIVGLGEVKDHLRIPATDRTRDGRLVQLIDGLAPVVEYICGPIRQTIYQNETYDGGSWFISLMHRPALEVHSVTEYRGPIPYPLTQIPTPDLGTIYSYMFEPPGRIVRRTVGGGMTPFPPGADQIFVTYTAGYANTPPEVREGTLELIRFHFTNTELGSGMNRRPANEDTIGAEILGFLVPNYVRELLQPRRRHISVA